jgi:hypothetical protein
MMIYLSLVDEFVQRNCLTRALTSMTEEEIEQLLSTLLPLLSNSKYSRSSILVLQTLLKSHPLAASWKEAVQTKL